MLLHLAFGSIERYQQSGKLKPNKFLPTTSLIREIYTSDGDPFEKYGLPHVNSDKIVNSWNSDPLKFYQNQLIFVTWCSTTGAE